jgi:hypothetical protein
MQVMVERCCGLDVHQETVVACVLVGAPGLRPRKELRTFGTMTRDLEALRDWLKAEGVTHVGMESTGIYWRPVYAVLEGHFEVIVGNARHVRNVPGRKTDVKDAEWIGELIRHGLIAKSFVPPRPLQELRDLLRYRRKLVESQAAERNRLLRLLETANIKLASVASDVFGVSGQAMLKALIEGNASAEEMAGLAKRRLRRKHDDLVLALKGRVEGTPPFLAELAASPARSGRTGYRSSRPAHYRAAQAVQRGARTPDADSRRGLGGRRGFDRGDRRRYERVPQRSSSGGLGRRLSR